MDYVTKPTHPSRNMFILIQTDPMINHRPVQQYWSIRWASNNYVGPPYCRAEMYAGRVAGVTVSMPAPLTSAM